MLAYSFVAYWNTTVQEWQNFTDEEIQKTAEAMSQGMTDSGLTFRIYDGDGQPLYMEKQISYDQEKEKTSKSSSRPHPAKPAPGSSARKTAHTSWPP